MAGQSAIRLEAIAQDKFKLESPEIFFLIRRGEKTDYAKTQRSRKSLYQRNLPVFL